MNAAIQIVLIACIFVSQILVLSFLTPIRRNFLYARMFTRYPPQQYPRLYPVPRERIERTRSWSSNSPCTCSSAAPPPSRSSLG